MTVFRPTHDAMPARISSSVVEHLNQHGFEFKHGALACIEVKVQCQIHKNR